MVDSPGGELGPDPPLPFVVVPEPPELEGDWLCDGSVTVEPLSSVGAGDASAGASWRAAVSVA